MNALLLLDKAIGRISGILLTISVFLMLTFSVLNVVFRWFEITYIWFDPFVRHLVFLTAFLGGVLATGRDSHIGIDIIGKYLESRHKWRTLMNVRRIIYLASFFVLCWLIMASYEFLKVEIEYGRESFLGIHSAVLVGIIPVGFGLIAYRYLCKFLYTLTVKASQEVQND